MAAKKNKSAKGKMGLGLRLKAWWEGYDADEIQKRIDARLPDEPVEEKPKKEAAEETKSNEDIDPWSDEVVDIAQYIWGKGFCGPGGPEYIISLSKLLALSPEMSMMQIGAGLGGPARVLVDRFGVWMTGYEESENLVGKGRQLSKMAGLEKKAVLEQYNPDDIEGFDRKFDRALSKEALFTINDKRGVIEKIEDKLKPGGLFLMTEYMIDNDSVPGKDRYKEWAVGERNHPCPITADDMVGILKDNRLQVRVSEDISMQYIDMINQAWAGADAVAAKLAKQEDGAMMIQTLMREAEFWTRRKKMLESGDLKLWRIVANKKSTGPSMMSDW
ncbi:methyltransferase domain-containing protein [Kordiimonas sp. SCSIO 12603]|uniref:SAM-dependent methyltransferase n=1 Tax=Kordiimonas sp. SCSIO 12603 TaxID=2829596 RepID=UPI0021026BD0|nr:methyltransferase domain-containing protein [Kordiimonas sp. SCSIO 12603]UTW58912.1 methyltransferase domain-containing protein [Kordiimonas sp. SCSIO 12603]